jgi:hypothetical protein
VLVAALLLGGSGCSTPEQGTVFLGVQLVTDLRAAEEFQFVDVAVDGEAPATRRVTASEVFLAPIRIIDFPALAPRRDRRVLVRLRHGDGREVLAREVTFEQLSSMTRTVTLTRSCVGVPCDTDSSCFAGRCVDAACTDGSESACAEPECTDSTACRASSGCPLAVCRLGACLYPFEATGCPVSGDAGPRDVDAGGAQGDGGTPDADAGTLDGGRPPEPDAGGTSRCDGGTCRLDAACASFDLDGSRYWLCQLPRTFGEAAAFCAADGARLVKIQSLNENRAIAQRIALITGTIGTSTAHYIGLSDRKTEGVFLWRDGSPLTYENWKANDPSGSSNACSNEDCVAMFASGGWGDVCCSSLHPFVCEMALP